MPLTLRGGYSVAARNAFDAARGGCLYIYLFHVAAARAAAAPQRRARAPVTKSARAHTDTPPGKPWCSEMREGQNPMDK